MGKPRISGVRTLFYFRSRIRITGSIDRSVLSYSPVRWSR